MNREKPITIEDLIGLEKYYGAPVLWFLMDEDTTPEQAVCMQELSRSSSQTVQAILQALLEMPKALQMHLLVIVKSMLATRAYLERDQE